LFQGGQVEAQPTPADPLPVQRRQLGTSRLLGFTCRRVIPHSFATLSPLDRCCDAKNPGNSREITTLVP
jgi:hypothetical protein